MAFLWRGVGRQQAGSRSLQELNRTPSGAQAAWDPGPHPGLGAWRDPAKRGVIRASSWGAAWDGDTSPRSVGAGMAKNLLRGLRPSLFQAPALKIKHFISGRLAPTMFSAIASLCSPASQPFPSVTVPSAVVTQIQAHI